MGLKHVIIFIILIFFMIILAEILQNIWLSRMDAVEPTYPPNMAGDKNLVESRQREEVGDNMKTDTVPKFSPLNNATRIKIHFEKSDGLHSSVPNKNPTVDEFEETKPQSDNDSKASFEKSNKKITSSSNKIALNSGEQSVNIYEGTDQDLMSKTMKSTNPIAKTGKRQRPPWKLKY